jgi:hypothetical protein
MLRVRRSSFTTSSASASPFLSIAISVVGRTGASVHHLDGRDR